MHRTDKNFRPWKECDDRMEFPSDIKRTKQREEIFRVLSQASEPMSAQDIYQHLVQAMGKGSLSGSFAISTVYRALAVFEEKGYVNKSTLMGEDMSYYEWVRGQHKHYAVCLKCHRLIPLKGCPFEHGRPDLDEEDFVITGHRLELYGYCGDCMQG